MKETLNGMTLSEAAKLREGTDKKLANLASPGIYVIPSNETTYIGFDDGINRRDIAFGWQPNEHDLLSNEWILID